MLRFLNFYVPKSTEEGFVFALVAGVIGLDFHQRAGFGGVHFRPLAVGAFYFGAINDGAVRVDFLGFFYFAACDGRLNRGLSRGRDFFPCHEQARLFLRILCQGGAGEEGEEQDK